MVVSKIPTRFPPRRLTDVQTAENCLDIDRLFTGIVVAGLVTVAGQCFRHQIGSTDHPERVICVRVISMAFKREDQK